MKQLKLYLKKKKYVLLFLSVLVLLGVAVGFFLSLANFSYLKENVLYFSQNFMNGHFSYLFLHFFFLVIALFFSFFGIGIAFLCAFIFFEGISLGLIIGLFSMTYSFSGFCFAILFFLVTKGVYFVFLLFYFMKCLEIARRMIGKFLYKTDPSHFLGRILKACGIVILVVFLSDLGIYFLGHKILIFFRFLLV